MSHRLGSGEGVIGGEPARTVMMVFGPGWQQYRWRIVNRHTLQKQSCQALLMFGCGGLRMGAVRNKNGTLASGVSTWGHFIKHISYV